MADKRIIKASSDQLIKWNLPPHLTGVAVLPLGEPKHNFIKVLPDWASDTCHVPEEALTPAPEWTQFDVYPSGEGMIHAYHGLYRGVRLVKHHLHNQANAPQLYYTVLYLGTSTSAVILLMLSGEPLMMSTPTSRRRMEAETGALNKDFSTFLSHFLSYV